MAVTETLPLPDSDDPYPVVFPFLFAAKLLYGFPPPTGLRPVERALSLLPDVDKSNMSHEVSFLGVCCEKGLHIIPARGDGKWVYIGDMTVVDTEQFNMETQIAHGDEDHFHRASIDTVFEWFRKRWGIGGGLMAMFVKEFFNKIKANGAENIQANYELAAESGIELYVVVSTAKR